MPSTEIPSTDRSPLRRAAAPLRRRAVTVVVVTLTAAVAAGTVASPVGAATTTKKAVTRAAVRAVSPAVAAQSAGAAATVPVSGTKSAGTPLTGWDRIADTDRPAVGDAVVADAVARSIIVRRAPGVDAGMLRFDAGRTVFGTLSLLALGGQDGWVRVLLPVRPNGTVGWVRREDVTLRRTSLRVVVELSTNTITVEDRGVVLAKARVATGTGGTPTPVGQFFVKEIVPQANPRGALGPWALGLSAYSEVLMSFAGGSGVVAIHGTNAPGRLGGNVSHGCIRVDNATISRLAGGLVPLGTPVEIVRSRADLPMVRQTSAWVEQVPSTSAGAAPTSTVAPAAVPAAAPTLPAATVVSAGSGAVAMAPTTTVG